MMCAASVTAQFVAGKAARDTLYLAHLPVTSLPAMMVATSICSILFALASARVLRRLSPASFVPARLPYAPSSSSSSGGSNRPRRPCRAPGLSAGFGQRSRSRLRVLADRQRAVQPAIGQEELRPHHGGRHAGRPRRRPAGGTRRRGFRHGGRAADAGVDQRHRRVAGSAPRRAAGCGGRDAAHGRRAGIVAGRSGPRSSRAVPSRLSTRPRGARGARHDGRGSCRLRLPRPGGELAGRRRRAAAFLRGLLRWREPGHVRRPGRAEPALPRTARVGGQRGHAVGGAARRRPGRDRRARPAEHRRGARRRIGVPRIAVPRQLRDLLHADGGGGAARRQVDHRRRVRSAGRRGWAPQLSGSCCFSWRRRSRSGRSSGWRWRRRRWRSC